MITASRHPILADMPSQRRIFAWSARETKDAKPVASSVVAADDERSG
jgi:hypothetical protein